MKIYNLILYTCVLGDFVLAKNTVKSFTEYFTVYHYMYVSTEYSCYIEMNKSTYLSSNCYFYTVWQYRLWSFQQRDKNLERFLGKNQLKSNEIIGF